MTKKRKRGRPEQIVRLLQEGEAIGMPWLKWSTRNRSLNADSGKEISCHENEVSTIRPSRL
jgi:hypothetical protein